MLDPRVQDNAEKIKKLEKALLDLAKTVEGLAYRTASYEERKSLDIPGQIKRILEEKI